MGQWIIPLGITAITFLILTFLFGYRVFVKLFDLNPRLNFKLHKIFAWLTVVTAVIHGLLVYIVYFA